MVDILKSIMSRLDKGYSIENSINVLPQINQEFFRLNNWEYKKQDVNVVVEGQKLIIESKKNKVSYLSLFEKNNNFNIYPKAKNKIIPSKDALVRISGKSSNKMKVTFYVIEYSNKQKIKVNRFFLNRENSLNLHPKTDTVRLAIRLEGKGEAEITNFKIIENFIPSSQGTSKSIFKLKKINELKMACIFDEFSMECFSDHINLITFTPENWKKTLSQNKPNLLMVESAWRGNFGSWEYQIGKYNNNENNRILKELISWCNRHRIPTVFWNKEDPIHFDKFINAAQLFDYIFTTDANMIRKYKEIVGHNRVYSMQFAANPKKHNPTMINKRKLQKISFAGSYYANRHPDRRKDMDEMLSIADKFGLDIFDRNFERNKSGNSHFQFPKELQKNIVGTLKYSEINRAYKDYKLILNVNSVKNSPTMFSRRVFEGLACGTPIVSSYSTGIKKTFNNTVVIAENKLDLEEKIPRLLTDNKVYREVAMEGIRKVFREHTYYHRLEYILDKLKINYKKEKSDITVIFTIDNYNDFNKALEIIDCQSFKDIKVLCLISIFEGFEDLLNKYNNDNISTYLIDYAFKYNSLDELVSTKYVTVMDIENEYGKYYIEDLMHAALYSNAVIVGKKSIFTSGNYDYSEHEYMFVDGIHPETAVFKMENIKKIHLKDLITNRNNIIDVLFKEQGANIYSADKFNIKIHSIE